MDEQAEFATNKNGQRIAGETLQMQPQVGSVELQRIIEAIRTGKAPDPDDVAAVRRLQPFSGAPSRIALPDVERSAEVIADLHSGDPQRQAQAWELVAPLLPAAADALRDSVERVTDWGAVDAPAREWLIPSWLPAGRIGMFSGKGGKGKTWMLLTMAAAMAAGDSEWLGRPNPDNALMPVTPGPVVFCSWEDEASEIKRRLQGMYDDDLFDRMKTPNGSTRFRFLDLSRRGPVWGATDRFQVATLQEAGELARAECEDAGARLLILDSLGYAYGGNESDNEGVAQFMADWDGWGRDHGCAVLLVHHPPKPQPGAQTAGYRGASSWEMHSRYRWELGDGKGDRDTATLTCEKFNYSRKPDPIYLERNTATRWAWQASKNQTAPDLENGTNKARRAKRANEV